MKANLKTMRDVLVLTFSAFAARLLFHLIYAPGWCLDSEDYSWRWRLIWDREWQSWDAYKTPGYPFLLGLAQGLVGAKPVAHLSYASGQAAIYLQQFAGLCAVVLLYFLLRNIEVGRRAAFWGALFFGTLMNICLFEILLLTQSLATSLLITALWLCSWALARAVRGQSNLLLAILSGIVFSLAALTRAEVSVFLLGLILTCVTISIIYRTRGEFLALRLVMLRVGLSALPLIIGWMSFNGLILGQFTLTTASSYNATSSVYNLFDRVPRKDRVFGKIMMKYYKGPARIDLVNDAWVELSAHAAEMPIKHRGPWTANADLMAYAGEVAHRLQRRYPLVLLSNSAKSFGRTFDFNQGRGFAQVPTNDPEAPDGTPVLKWPKGRNFAEAIRAFQAPVMFAFYCIMLLLIPGALIMTRMGKVCPPLKLAFAFAIALTTATTLVAFGFAHTYFSHYGLVYFGCIVICGIVGVEVVIDWLKSRSSRARWQV